MCLLSHDYVIMLAIAVGLLVAMKIDQWITIDTKCKKGVQENGKESQLQSKCWTLS